MIKQSLARFFIFRHSFQGNGDKYISRLEVLIVVMWLRQLWRERVYLLFLKDEDCCKRLFVVMCVLGQLKEKWWYMNELQQIKSLY